MSTIIIINIVVMLISLVLLFLSIEDNTRCYMYTTVGRRYWWLPVVLITALLLLSLVNLYLIASVYVVKV